MTFIDAYKFYFTIVLDFTLYFEYFLISLGFVIYTWPKDYKELTKKDILLMVAKFVGMYATCVVVASLFFAIANSWNASMIFNLCMPIIVGFAGAFFTTGNKLHRFIKTCVLVASVLVVEVLSKTTGFLFGGNIEGGRKIIVIAARSLPYIAMPIIAYILHKVDIARFAHISTEMITIISVLGAALIGVAIFEHIEYIEDKMTNIILMILDIVLLFILTFSYYATYKNIENRHKITNLEVQKTLEDAERMSIEIDRNNREELQKLRHDMKNQISYLTILIQQGKNDEALKYINELTESKDEIINSFSCSNNVLNSIINLELTKAKIKKVKMDIKVVVPPLLPFKDNDLVSLVTNMIDNALENYSSNEEEQITVRILKQNDFIRFFTSNPTEVEKLKGANFTTTRKSGRGHGYGTKIIRNITKLYNGYVEFSVEGNRFICDAVLDLNQKV